MASRRARRAHRRRVGLTGARRLRRLDESVRFGTARRRRSVRRRDGGAARAQRDRPVRARDRPQRGVVLRRGARRLRDGALRGRDRHATSPGRWTTRRPSPARCSTSPARSSATTRPRVLDAYEQSIALGRAGAMALMVGRRSRRCRRVCVPAWTIRAGALDALYDGIAHSELHRLSTVVVEVLGAERVDPPAASGGLEPGTVLAGSLLQGALTTINSRSAVEDRGARRGVAGGA